MKHLRWALVNALRQGGLPAWVALALLAATAAAWWLALVPASTQLDALRNANVQLLRQVAQARPTQAQPATLADELSAFETRFENERSIGPALARLHAAAQRHGVVFNAGAFRLESSAPQPLARYVMDWPVQGDYRALRRFMADALREQPALALEAVSLQRSDPASPQVVASLRWVLFIARPI